MLKILIITATIIKNRTSNKLKYMNQILEGRESAGFNNEQKSKESTKETLFKGMLINALFDAIKQSMEDNDLDESEITSFFATLSKLPEDQILATLAIPAELQHAIFSKLAEKIAAEQTTVQEFMLKSKDQALKKGYCVGFHVSNQKILPTMKIKDGVEQVEKWEIKGTEKDHRDGDLPKAYYSLDYQNLYRKKQGKFMYLVRAETHEESDHKRDNDGSWGRASSLPIITVLDLSTVDKQINDQLSSQKTNEPAGSTAGS